MRSLYPHILHSALLLAIANGSWAQCHIVEPSTTPTDTVSYSFVGGSFARFGCAAIDPTYWLSGSGVSVTASFSGPMDFPGIRVWGMNSDDVASVSVNGSAYPLDAASAYYEPKVVCGLSPGPDGVVFSSGNLTGANTPVDGNFSYQDVYLNATGVTSITVSSLAGAGWGFDGILLECSIGITEQNGVEGPSFPNPTSGEVHLPLAVRGTVDAMVINGLGVVVKQVRTTDGMIDLSDLDAGVYSILVLNGPRSVHRVIKR